MTTHLKKEKRGNSDMNIWLWILVFIGGTTGALSTLYIVISLFATIIYKIYRKVKYNISIFD
jgi:hypothetical protein